jgi:hypothetical protein
MCCCWWSCSGACARQAHPIAHLKQLIFMPGGGAATQGAASLVQHSRSGSSAAHNQVGGPCTRWTAVHTHSTCTTGTTWCELLHLLIRATSRQHHKAWWSLHSLPVVQAQHGPSPCLAFNRLPPPPPVCHLHPPPPPGSSALASSWRSWLRVLQVSGMPSRSAASGLRTTPAHGGLCVCVGGGGGLGGP